MEIDPAITVGLDVVEFAKIVDACHAHVHRRWDACPECMAHLEQAVALYRGDFLADMTAQSAKRLRWLIPSLGIVVVLAVVVILIAAR